jgi:hypothetical protein
VFECALRGVHLASWTCHMQSIDFVSIVAVEIKVHIWACTNKITCYKTCGHF